MAAPVAQQKHAIFDGLVNLELTGGAGAGQPAAGTGYGYGSGKGMQQRQSLDMMMGCPGSGSARRMSTGMNMGANAGLDGIKYGFLSYRAHGGLPCGGSTLSPPTRTPAPSLVSVWDAWVWAVAWGWRLEPAVATAATTTPSASRPAGQRTTALSTP